MDGLYGGLEMEIEGLECGCVGHVDHRKTAVEMAFWRVSSWSSCRIDKGVILLSLFGPRCRLHRTTLVFV